jgi:glutamyl-tRNA reductase
MRSTLPPPTTHRQGAHPGAPPTLPLPKGRGTGGRSSPLLLVGTSHHAAPVALRERLLGKAGERAIEQLGFLVREKIGSAVVVSTCNRLEVYCWTERRESARSLVRLLAAWSGLPQTALRPHLYVYRGVAAAQHLIRVAAGLDSLALGESQVLGQVRDAWAAARREAPLGPEFELLFRRAVEAARRIRRAGGLSHHPSVAGVAVHTAVEVLGGLRGRQVAVLGAGVTGQDAARALLAAGAAHVTLLNRSRRRLADLGADLPAAHVTRERLDDLPRVLCEVDLLVCATASPAPVVSNGAVAEALPVRAGRPLLLLDIAVPRDIALEVRHLPGVTLLDLDDLAEHCALDAPARHAALERAAGEARSAAEAYVTQLRLRDATPDIVALRRAAAAARAEALRRFGGRLRDLTPDQRAAVEQLTHTIVQKLLHAPTLALRGTATLPPTGARRHRALVMDTLGVLSRHSGGSK